jgi:hypothetical protein
VIKAAYACLKEAEHRSTFLLPYWNVPILGQGHTSIVPRQREFAAHLDVLNDKLEEMITLARSFKNQEDLASLEARDYANIKDPSLLRFLVDLRGGDCDDKQLRDDLMTLLVAGHETTGSLLTWTAFELAQHPEEMRKVQAEVDAVLGTGPARREATLDDIRKLSYTRLVLSEGLRLYPQPPILLRRALKETQLPKAHGGEDCAEYCDAEGMQRVGTDIAPGANVFISAWNLHRNPRLWDNPDKFDPSRFTRPQAPPPSTPTPLATSLSLLPHVPRQGNDGSGWGATCVSAVCILSELMARVVDWCGGMQPASRHSSWSGYEPRDDLLQVSPHPETRNPSPQTLASNPARKLVQAEAETFCALACLAPLCSPT